MSDPNPLRYGIKRFMRIWPPLAAFVLIATFAVGPILSNLSPEEYYANPGWREYLANLRLDIRFALPGVFEQNPYPTAINGSLWSLPVEVAMYVCVPVLLSICKARTHPKVSRWILLGICMAVCAINIWQYIYHPRARLVIYGTDWVSALQIIPFYLIGMVCNRFDIRRYLNLQIAAVLMIVLSCVKMNYVAMQLVLFLSLPYIVFSIVFAPDPVFYKLGTKMEISYGLYLYGFFIQQIVVYVAMNHGIALSYMKAFVLSCVLTALVAYLSRYLLERPIQRLTRQLIAKIK